MKVPHTWSGTYEINKFSDKNITDFNIFVYKLVNNKQDWSEFNFEYYLFFGNIEDNNKPILIIGFENNNHFTLLTSHDFKNNYDKIHNQLKKENEKLIDDNINIKNIPETKDIDKNSDSNIKPILVSNNNLDDLRK